MPKPKKSKKKLPVAEESKQEIIAEAIIEEPVEKVVEEAPLGVKLTKEFDKEAWQPKTELGKEVKAGKIKEIDEIIDKGTKILEAEIIDVLSPNLESDLISIGQSKGKFGGGKRSIWRQTQKKTKEGNKPSFSTVAVIGNRNGYVSLGFGKAKETVPAREKAIRKAKINLIRIRRGCGSWECSCKQPHSIPFTVSGRCGSVRINIFPAPKGTGLCIQDECKKILSLAGISDVYSETFGQTRSRINLIYACFEALKSLTKVKLNQSRSKDIIEGAVEYGK